MSVARNWRTPTCWARTRVAGKPGVNTGADDRIESPRTTKLYDRANDAIRAEAIITDGLSMDERACPAVLGMERILI